ncbi:MAG: hypothetical protein OMM_04435 [Candidatus Magnetoglobus multicellularis str. Araruama]|uniref:Adhesin domain-containing protein n=1 Tax=Candidatus Magnetoglobus multicellularis str. Araruama TaxID=890399 RepID=A0A1V1P1B6_9BACT|nr:MAG: hypothetical protein OMM_04435 [Candidatus Magnetoglobus multicellularis str. Araruama]
MQEAKSSKSTIESDDDIILIVEQGDLVVDSIISGGNIELTALTGSIINSAYNSEVDIQAGLESHIILTAFDNILNIDLGENSFVKSATATSGNIQLKGAGALTIQDISTDDGAIIITAQKDLNITSIIAGDTDKNNEHDIILESIAGSIETGTLTSDHNLSFVSAGSISASGMISADDATLTAVNGR